MEIQPLKELLPDNGEAELVAQAAGHDVNDIFLCEPTMLDYQVAMTPSKHKTDAERELLLIHASFKDHKQEKKVLPVEVVGKLSADVGLKLKYLANHMAAVVYERSLLGSEDALGKLPQLASLTKKRKKGKGSSS